MLELQSTSEKNWLSNKLFGKVSSMFTCKVITVDNYSRQSNCFRCKNFNISYVERGGGGGGGGDECFPEQKY